MREIKFRAWGKFKRIMHESGNGSWGMTDTKIGLKGFEKPKENEEADELILMQYTGLKDKNGKQIYQGDIIKIQADKEGYGIVSYEGFAEITSQTCGYGLRVFNPTEEEMEAKGISYDSSSLWHIGDDNGKWIEIIGNIYENPELIK